MLSQLRTLTVLSVTSSTVPSAPYLGMLIQSPTFEHVVGRQLDARYETQDAVAEDQHEDRGRSAQTGEEHRRRAVEKNREDEDDGDQKGDDLSGLHQALQRLAFHSSRRPIS